jgi:hypothetical protein
VIVAGTVAISTGVFGRSEPHGVNSASPHGA